MGRCNCGSYLDGTGRRECWSVPTVLHLGYPTSVFATRRRRLLEGILDQSYLGYVGIWVDGTVCQQLRTRRSCLQGRSPLPHHSSSLGPRTPEFRLNGMVDTFRLEPGVLKTGTVISTYTM